MSQVAPVQQPYSNLVRRCQPYFGDLTCACVCQGAPVQQPYSSLLPFEEPEPLPGRLLASLAFHEPVSPSHAGESQIFFHLLHRLEMSDLRAFLAHDLP